MALSATADLRIGMKENLPSGGKHARLRRIYDQTKSAEKLALKHRKAIEAGDFTPFIPALAFAIAKDAIFDLIPIMGTVFGAFISVYLFIFLWGKGKWKVRIIIFILSFLDLIPGANLLPMTTIFVLYTYHQAKKDFKEEEKKAREGGSEQEKVERVNQEMKKSAANSMADMDNRKEEFDRREEERKMRRAEERQRLENTMKTGEDERNKRESFYNRRNTL